MVYMGTDYISLVCLSRSRGTLLFFIMPVTIFSMSDDWKQDVVAPLAYSIRLCFPIKQKFFIGCAKIRVLLTAESTRLHFHCTQLNVHSVFIMHPSTHITFSECEFEQYILS